MLRHDLKDGSREGQMSDSALTIKEGTMDVQLIADNPKEETLIRIRSLQMQNLTAIQREKITNLETIIYTAFIRLISVDYGLSREQLFEFKDDQIESLFEIVNLSTKRRAIIGGILMWTFGLLIPIIGWISLFFMHEDEIPLSYFYRRNCNKLRKILGDKYLSVRRLRKLNT